MIRQPINKLKEIIQKGIEDPFYRWFLGIFFIFIPFSMLLNVLVILDEFSYEEVLDAVKVPSVVHILGYVFFAVILGAIYKLSNTVMEGHINMNIGILSLAREVAFCKRWNLIIGVIMELLLISSIVIVVFIIWELFFSNLAKVLPESIFSINEMGDIISIICLFFSLSIFLLRLIIKLLLIVSRIVYPEPIDRKNFFVNRVLAIGFGTIGVVVAALAPYILVIIKTGGISNLDDLPSFLSLAVIITIAILLLLIYPSILMPSFDQLVGKKEKVTRFQKIGTFFVAGTALPALIISFLQGASIHSPDPEKYKGTPTVLEETASIDERYYTGTDKGGIPILLSIAYADETTEKTLESTLNAPLGRISRASNYLSSDLGAKNFVISIAGFNNPNKTIAFRDNCMKDKHKVSNSQAIQLVKNEDYRVIFPGLKNKMAKGEATYKMDLIKEEVLDKGECEGVDPSLLEFD